MMPEPKKGDDLGECPECKKGRLVVRQNRKTGSEFVGCSQFPNCRYTQSVDDYHKPGDFSWSQR